MKIAKLHLLILIFSFLSCEKQDVVNSVDADYGVLKENVETSLSYISNLVPSEDLKTETLTFSNTGGFPLTNFEVSGLEEPLSYNGDSFPGEGGDCSDTIEIGKQCTIVLSIKTEVETIKKLSITISYNDGVRDIKKIIPLSVSILKNAEMIIAPGEFSNIDELKNVIVSPIRFPRTKLGETNKSLFSIGNTGRRLLTFKSTDLVGSDYGFTGGVFPGLNGNCKDTLVPHEMCLVEIFYSPNQVETVTYDMNFSINDGSSDQIETRKISLESADERANLTFGISTNYNFGEIVQSDQKVINFLILNNTVVPANAMTFTFSNPDLQFTGGSYPGLGGDCDSNIEPFSFCKIEVIYSRSSLGNSSTNLVIDYNDNNFFDPQMKSSNLAFNAEIVTPASFDVDPITSANGHGLFGAIKVQLSESHGLSIKNSGDFEGIFVGAELVNNGDDVFSIIPGGSCGTTVKNLKPNKYCSINIKALHNLIGDYTATLRLSYTNGSSIAATQTVDIPLSVTFSDTSDIRVVGNSNFGAIPIPSSLFVDRSFTFTNHEQGTANLNLDTSNLAVFEYSITSNTCGATLVYNQSCVLSLRYQPTSLGTDSAILDLNIVDPLKSYRVRLVLSGEARSHGDANIYNSDDVNLASVDFNGVEVGKSHSKFIRVRNSGGYSTSALSAVVSGSAFSIDGVTCNDLGNLNLGGNGSGEGSACVAKLTFSPIASTAYTENLTLNYFNGEVTVNEIIPITGTGESVGVLEIQGDQDLFTFSDTIIGDTDTITFNFENTGSTNITNINFTPGSSVFQWDDLSNTCLGTLAPTQTCSINLEFSPDTSTTSTAFGFVTYDTNGKSYENFLRARGTGQAPPNIKVSLQGQGLISSYDFGESPIGQQSYIKILVTNAGEAAAYNIDAQITGDSEFSYVGTTCNNGDSVTGNITCEYFLIYLASDSVTNTSQFSISFDNVPTLTVDVTGEGIEPSAGFDTWKNIYAVTGDSTGTVKLKWSPIIPSSGVVVTGYKVYESTNPLPLDNSSLAGFEVADINSLFEASLIFNKSGYAPGDNVYFAIRGKYEGGVIESSDTLSMLKVVIPPKNMALVHPYIVNQEFCGNIGVASEKEKNFGCVYSGQGNINGYFDFNRFLFVDIYESSKDASNEHQSKKGVIPEEYSNVIEAGQACKGVSELINGVSFTKSLIRRSEFVASAAWDELLQPADIQNFEDGGGENCAVGVDNAVETGSRDNCVSKFGIHDMSGNLWEWNSDIIDSKFGARSSIDTTNEEIFGLHLGNQLPGEHKSKDCFSFYFGLSQINLGSCSNGVVASTAADVLGDNYFWPPLVNDQRAIRSGGSVGPSSDQTSREAGRWVADLNQGVLSNVALTTARCAIRAPFNPN
jgi:hypothetical protein